MKDEIKLLALSLLKNQDRWTCERSAPTDEELARINFVGPALRELLLTYSSIRYRYSNFTVTREAISPEIREGTELVVIGWEIGNSTIYAEGNTDKILILDDGEKFSEDMETYDDIYQAIVALNS